MCASFRLPSFPVVIFLVLSVFCVYGTLSSDFEPGGRPETKLINPDAEAVIGAVVNIRERGSGLFGCGDRRLEGVIVADALKWMVNELNQKIWSETSSNLSLGLYLMDSCGRTRTAASQLVDFLPELKSDERSLQENSSFKFCVIDDIGLGNEADISKSLEDIDIAIIDTDININSPQVLVNAVLLFIQELRWERLVVVHSNSKFSSAMLKHFTKLLKKFDLCVAWVVNLESEDEIDFQKIFKSGVPIVSLLASEEHSLLLRTMQDLSDSKKITVMFSDSVTRKQLKIISSYDVKVLSVFLYPEKEPGFESFYSKNSIISGIRTEDELDLIQRTRTVRKIKQIGEKLSIGLRSAMKVVCKKNQSLCPDLLTAEGRNAVKESISNMEWTSDKQLYQLVEYRYQFPDEHVYMHKIMIYNTHKNLEIFDTNISFTDINCDGEKDSRLECRCLEMKSVRTGSARNIDQWGSKKERQYKHTTAKEKILTPEIQSVDQLLSKPMVFEFLNDPLNGTLACLTLLGALITLVIAQYFATFAALPNGGLTTGTSVIGYVILIGLFLLFLTNISFLLAPLASTCALRRFCTSFCYAVVFSGMLIKVWSTLRHIQSEKAKSWKPFTLLLYSGAFSLFQLLPSGLWLTIKPPGIEYVDHKWVCYPPGDMDFHLMISMIYPILLLLLTLVLAIRTCSKSNKDEARWILISSSLIVIIFSCWALAIATGVWQMHRTASVNLTAATILLLCLYIPKIKLHSDLKKSMNSQVVPTPISVELDKDCQVFSASSQYPVVMGYDAVAPAMPENVIESSYLNQAYSIDESSDTVSTPFDFDSSSFSEIEQGPYTFSTFLEEPQTPRLETNGQTDDPTQVIPSALYPIDMFNNEPVTSVAITSDHCQPGSNEFTPPHRTTSQLYLCPQPEWVP